MRLVKTAAGPDVRAPRSLLAATLLFGLAACAHAPATSSTPATDAAPGPAPAQEWTVTAGDATLHALAFGPAGERTLIVVSGGPGVSHDYVLGLRTLAGPDVRVVFYDQRGSGLSTTPAAGRWDVATYVDDLEAVRQAVGANRPWILGHSWGGAVALQYAAKYPDQLSGLIIADSMAMTSTSKAEADKQVGARIGELKKQGHIPAHLPKQVGDDCLPAQRAYGPIYYANPSHPSAHKQAGTCSTRVFDLVLDTLKQFDFRPDAARVTAPTLVIYGDKDPFQTAQSVADFTGSLPRARAAVMPTCGHIPWIECPTPFWSEMRSFMGLPAR